MEAGWYKSSLMNKISHFVRNDNIVIFERGFGAAARTAAQITIFRQGDCHSKRSEETKIINVSLFIII